MSRYRKFIVALVAFLGILVSSGLLHGAAEMWVNVVVTGVGAVLVYVFPNEPKTTPPSAG